MLDEIDRAFFAQKLADAFEKAQAANDQRAARSYLELAAEYWRELDKLQTQSG